MDTKSKFNGRSIFQLARPYVTNAFFTCYVTNADTSNHNVFEPFFLEEQTAVLLALEIQLLKIMLFFFLTPL
jgi:hypothetical protein